MNTLSSLLNFIGGKIAEFDEDFVILSANSSAESISLASGASGGVTITPPQVSGYRARGIVSVRKNGGNNNDVAISTFYMDTSGNGYIGLTNNASASRTVGVYATFIYTKVVGG